MSIPVLKGLNIVCGDGFQMFYDVDSHQLTINLPADAGGNISLVAPGGDIIIQTSLYAFTINEFVTFFNTHGHPYLGGIIPAVTDPPNEIVP
jgi:hypothetical protein